MVTTISLYKNTTSAGLQHYAKRYISHLISGYLEVLEIDGNDPMLGYLVMFRMYNNKCFYEMLQAQQKIMTITITEFIPVKLCSKIFLLASCAQASI